MKTKPLYEISDIEAMPAVEKMIDASVKFADGAITYEQLWCRCRGYRRNMAVQKVKDQELGRLLYQLSLDFMCWKDENDEIVKQSAMLVAQWAR